MTPTRSILAVVTLAALAWGIALVAPRPLAAAPGKNLKIYPAGTDTTEIKKDMKLISKALGVQCDFCHDLDDFSKDVEHKDVARGMMKMTASINAKLKKDGFKGEVKCITCHAGAEKPKK
ncbi:MAG TPA: c-type cytochrome [Kofleriaceae bacterium]|nr:c-type cytochrome [Kofleriaceae bacterium]